MTREAGEVECVWQTPARVGEGPVWVAEERALYWVDIKQPAVHRLGLDDGARRSWPMPERIGFLVPRAGGGFVAGFKSGLVLLAPATLAAEPLLRLEPEVPGNRLNDGKVDAHGALWTGSMDDAEREPSGWLYRVAPDLGFARADGPYAVTNGPAFSPDGGTLYHADTLGGTVYAFSVSDDGMLAGKRVFARIPPAHGYPDGMTTDAQGCLWLAHWGGWRLTRFTPRGQVDRVVRLPVAQVSSCAFAGERHERLFVTTAAYGLDAAAAAGQPLAGSLFEVRDPGVDGLSPGRFAG